MLDSKTIKLNPILCISAKSQPQSIQATKVTKTGETNNEDNSLSILYRLHTSLTTWA